MPYIGNTPALDYISYAVQNFTVTAGTTVYTLDYSVANENDIRLVINNVIQRPGASYAYSATGTTLTLTSATLSTDTMYAVFIGRAVQTVTPPANSITNTMLNSSAITGQTAETSVAGGDLVLIYDDSATALRKMTRTNFVAGLSVSNTPAFYASKSDAQTFTSGSGTKIQFNTEIFDTDNCYDPTTNYRFTPNVAGKYFVGASLRWDSDVDWDIATTAINKNGSSAFDGSYSNIRYNNWFVGTIVSMNGTTDYLEAFATQISGSNKNNYSDGNQFFAYKLIGV